MSAALLLLMAAPLAVPLAAAGGGTLPAGEPVEDGVVLTIGNAGIDFLAEQGSNLLDQHVPMQFGNSISCGAGTFTYSVFPGVEQNALDVEFDTFTVTPRDGYLDLSFTGSGRGTGIEAGLTSVVARYTLSGCSCSCGGSIRLPLTAFTGTVRAQIGLQNGVPFLDLNSLTLDIPTPNLSYSGCTGGICGSVLSFFDDEVAEAATAKAEEEIEEYIENETVPILNAALATLASSSLVTVAGAPLSVEVRPTTVSITSAAGISISARTTIAAPATAACAGSAASARIEQGVPPASSPIARLSVSGDALNQALAAVWGSGALCRRVDEIGGTRLTVGSLAIPELQAAAAELGLGDSTPLSIELRPGSPPEMRLDAAEPRVALAGLDVRLLAAVEGRIVRLASVRVDGELAVTLALDGDVSTTLRIASLAVASMTASATYDEVLGEEAAAVLATALGAAAEAWAPLLAETLPGVDLGNPGVQLRDLVVASEGGALHLDAGLAPAGGGCAAATPAGCGIEACTLAPARARGAWGGALVAIVALASVVARRRER